MSTNSCEFLSGDSQDDVAENDATKGQRLRDPAAIGSAITIGDLQRSRKPLRSGASDPRKGCERKPYGGAGKHPKQLCDLLHVHYFNEAPCSLYRKRASSVCEFSAHVLLKVLHATRWQSFSIALGNENTGEAVTTKKTWGEGGRGKRVILHGVPIGVAHGSVELVPYDDRWPALFASEAALLHTGLDGQMGRIAHIGSTAIRGMDAKPIIDLMVEVPSLRAPNLLHWSLSRFGYALVPEDDVPDRLFFVKLMQGHPTHHLSTCEAQSNFWYAHLSFRDRLRADSSLAKEYAALKWQLSREHRNDRAAYTRAKEAFISAVLAR